MIVKHTANALFKWLAYILAGLILPAVIVATPLYYWRRRTDQTASLTARSQGAANFAVTGLSEAEAAARLEPGQDNLIRQRTRRTRQQMIRESTLTIFNLNLVGLSFVQVLLGRPLDALITAGVLIFTIGVKVFQEEFARYRIRGLLEAIHPQTTVIREGLPQAIDVNQIVVGDALSAGPGDQIWGDGHVVQGPVTVDESVVSGDSTPLTKQSGDLLFAGSICLNGQAIYQVEKTGADRMVIEALQKGGDNEVELTPIEQILNRIMRVVLVIVIFLAAVLVIRYFRLDLGQLTDEYVDAVGVVFNLAPASLFFMVVLTYVAATADLAKLGALVHQARSVESLAQIDTMCVAKNGILTDTIVQIRPQPAKEDTTPPNEVSSGEEVSFDDAALRQQIGDYAQSISADNLVIQAMRSTFPGTRRVVPEEVALMSIYGWSALVFNDDALQGTYVLGDPQLLMGAAITEEEPQEQESNGLLSGLTPTALGQRASSLTRPLGRFFGRGNNDGAGYGEEAVVTTSGAGENVTMAQPAQSGEASIDQGKIEETSSGSLLGRLQRRMAGLLSRTQVDVEALQESSATDDGATILAFAYIPELVPLYDENGEPELPQNLMTLCQLSYREQIRPEAVEAIRSFSKRDVVVKVLTTDDAGQTLESIERVMLGNEGAAELLQSGAINAPELATLDPEQVAQTVEEHSVFGRVGPQHAEQIVRILRNAGHAVAVFGNGINDVPAMRQAELSLTRDSSSPGALSTGDIVLLDESPLVLSRTVDKGQRIVNGLLDVLKLYLTQVFYLPLLIVGILLAAYGFPYSSAQGGGVALLTLTIPAIGLSLWATGGALPDVSLGRELAHFVIPASATMALAGLAVFIALLEQSGDVDYTQLVLTYALVVMGLLLVIFIKPPLRFSRDRLVVKGDVRPTLLVLICALLFLVLTHIPLAQRLFDIAPLQQPSHYLVVGAVVLVWTLSVQLIWLAVPLQPRVHVTG